MMATSKVIYRRRRLAALLALLLLIGVIWGGIALLRGGGSPASSASSSASSSGDAKVPECSQGVLSVSVSTDASRYSLTDHPVLTMSVKNTSDADCRANVGTSQQQFVVGSGDQSLWFSRPCITNSSDAVRTLRAGQTLRGKVSWDGTTNTAQSCSKSTAGTGQPGTYWVTAALGDTLSAKATFVLAK